MSEGCRACGDPIARKHHLTGRDDRGRYLDPELIQDLCHDHHELIHDDLNTLELEKATQELTWFERVEIRLRRGAAYCARLDQASSTTTLYGILARILERWADELARGIRTLDELYPDWRRHRDFYPEP